MKRTPLLEPDEWWSTASWIIDHCTHMLGARMPHAAGTGDHVICDHLEASSPPTSQSQQQRPQTVAIADTGIGTGISIEAQRGWDQDAPTPTPHVHTSPAHARRTRSPHLHFLSSRRTLAGTPPRLLMRGGIPIRHGLIPHRSPASDGRCSWLVAGPIGQGSLDTSRSDRLRARASF